MLRQPRPFATTCTFSSAKPQISESSASTADSGRSSGQVTAHWRGGLIICISYAAAPQSVAHGPIVGPSPERSTEEPNAEQAASAEPYTFRVFRKQAMSVPLRFGGAAAAISIGGFSKWNWGSAHFRFNSEGWFGKDTASMGMDKLGHAYSAYVLTEFFSDGIKKRSAYDRSGSYTGAILSMGLMTYIEVFDGFSEDHGFSYEDLLVDGAGALFSVVRRSVPGLRDKIDFRLLYVPSQSTWRALVLFSRAPL